MAGGATALEMKALAEAFAAMDPGYDFGLESLKLLEERMRGASVKSPDVLSWAAYLGETIVRQSGGRIEWADSTRGAQTGDAAHAPSSDRPTPVLRAGTTEWFPLSKVHKRLTHGKSENLAAFAGVVLAMSAPSEDKPRPIPVAREDFNEYARTAVEAFIASPSVETLATFSRQMHGRVYQSDYATFYRVFGVTRALFTPFFGAPAQGRGSKRFDPGRVAAWQVVALVTQGIESEDVVLAELAAELAHKDKLVRDNCAYASAKLHLRAGRFDEVLELVKPPDPAIRVGVFRALCGIIGEARSPDRRSSAPTDITLLLPLFHLGLAGDGEVFTLAVEAIGGWRGDVAPLLPSIIDLLDHKKPSVVESATHILTNYAYAVKHGRATYRDEIRGVARRFAALTRSEPGAKKVKRTQIAAKYALNALHSIRERFDAQTMALIEDALGQSRHIA